MWQLKDKHRDVIVTSQYHPELCPFPAVAVSTGGRVAILSIEEARELTRAFSRKRRMPSGAAPSHSKERRETD